MIGSYLGDNKELEGQYLQGQLDMELIPQGTLAEKLRAGGAGIPAFYTPTGNGTLVEQGGFPIRYGTDGKTIVKKSTPKEKRVFDGREYVLEEAIKGDFSLVKAWKADPKGNVLFRKSARNFNPDIAVAGKVCIVEVEEIVPIGSIDPDEVHLPDVYVHRVVKGESYIKPVEKLTVNKGGVNEIPGTGEQKVMRERIVRRAAKEIKDGMYVNLGIGIPTLCANYLQEGIEITLQSENGILGLGQFPPEDQVDPDLINAGKQTVTVLKGANFFSSSQSFAMIRGRHMNMSILGGLQVSQRGDLANWIIPGKLIKGMGGAMDLVSGANRVIITMEHTAKGNEPKVLQECTHPLTGKEVVDMLITDQGVFTFDK